MLIINKVLHNRMIYNQMKLKYVLQQLHCYRYNNWQITQNKDKLKLNKKWKGTNLRRSDIGIL